MSKQKLPKVWVMFNVNGGAFVSAVTPPSPGQKVGVRHRYAPVQKPKRCDGHPAYRQAARDNGFKFCPYCGGKIKVKK